jgi:hypothetical protein
VPTIDLGALTARVGRAVVPADAPQSLGVQASKDEPGKVAVTTQCGRALPSDSDMLVGLRRTWQTRRGVVQSFVFGYERVSGATVLSEVRALNGACTSYQLDGEPAVRHVVGPYTTKPLTGVTDVYAYSEKISDTHMYFGFIARDNLVAVVVSVARNVTWARDDFDRMLPLGAAALLAA